MQREQTFPLTSVTGARRRYRCDTPVLAGEKSCPHVSPLAGHCSECSRAVASGQSPDFAWADKAGGSQATGYDVAP
jgi:hypothetical protein